MTQSDPFASTITEPARQTRVCYEADVAVVGGGPGGHSAAVASARSGAKTILLERYGHLGGMTTGGLVTMLHSMSDGTSQQIIAGLCQEWLDRLDARNAVNHPRKEEIGSTDKEVLSRWPSRFFVTDGHLLLGAHFDPEILKCVLNDMAVEAGVKLYLHSWGTQILADQNQVNGVIFESKSGRQAILAKVVIDGTGDGDFLPQTGEEFDCKTRPTLRTNKPALVFEFANVDMRKANDFKNMHPEKHSELMKEAVRLNGFGSYFGILREGVAHFNMFLLGFDILNVEDLTRIEVDVRKRMLTTYEFYKKHVPGFEKCFIMLTAPQVGCRGSRRLVGEYIVTEKDARSGLFFEDTIAVFSPLAGIKSDSNPHVHIPYRCLLPRKMEGLLVAGRSFASDDIINEQYNTISHCIALGQAAGTAAALAVKNNVRLRDVNSRLLQDKLIEQGVPLPGLIRS
jgi:hypothetical protein